MLYDFKVFFKVLLRERPLVSADGANTLWGPRGNVTKSGNPVWASKLRSKGSQPSTVLADETDPGKVTGHRQMHRRALITGAEILRSCHCLWRTQNHLLGAFSGGEGHWLAPGGTTAPWLVISYSASLSSDGATYVWRALGKSSLHCSCYKGLSSLEQNRVSASFMFQINWLRSRLTSHVWEVLGTLPCARQDAWALDVLSHSSLWSGAVSTPSSIL